MSREQEDKNEAAHFLTTLVMTLMDGAGLSRPVVLGLVNEMLEFSADEETAEFYGHLIAKSARAEFTGRDVH
jgi:hypothetical protein